MRIDCTDGRYCLYQWDLNQRLIIDERVAPGTQVHFSAAAFPEDTEAPVVASYEEAGVLYANIPNRYLQRAGKVTVYVYVDNGDEHHTTYVSVLTVKPRKKPTDYVYTETEVLSYESLETRIDELERNGVSETQIAAAVEKYLDENPVDTGIDFTPGNALELTNDGVLNVKTTKDMEEDNTLPITSAGVYTVVGNINALLKTI